MIWRLFRCDGMVPVKSLIRTSCAIFSRQEQIAIVLYLFLVTGMMGIWLVINTDFKEINRGDIFGLLSAVVAAFAVITLNMARKNDSTMVILFYLMSIGTVFEWIGDDSRFYSSSRSAVVVDTGFRFDWCAGADIHHLWLQVYFRAGRIADFNIADTLCGDFGYHRFQ